MAFTAYRTWVAGEIVTAALLNEQIRDNGRYHHGDDGVPTILSGLIIDNTDGDEYLKLPLLTTAECSTVLNAEGEVAFDEQTHQMKEYDGTAVRALISEADVDDTPVNGADTVPVSSNWAYDHINLLTTAGDITYATAAGVWARLPIGTAGQVLITNAGATAPVWAAKQALITSGTYAGNNGTNTAIAHSLGISPKFVVITDDGNSYIRNILINAPTAIMYVASGASGARTVTAMDATNFYVGDGTNHDQAGNLNGANYYWVAIG